MERHNQIHNDVKPSNYLVKFLNGNNDLSRIEIVLTDFGLAGPDSKGGTPMFASPECLADSDRKDKSTDIFSLGRVFLFLIVSKQHFLEFLFISLTNSGKEKTTELILAEPILNLISKMMLIENRIKLQTIRNDLQLNIRTKITSTIVAISESIQKSISDNSNKYIDILKNFS